ncbi:unnamed protein product (macronuclear) [Paramecium tetraurelia]|uniref:Uncharacterized protein n=1 Tax=Paramecium tetraurelia TaxID=5888 RepID=A0DX83_PARTE|nr:uncharacterized protein GSPATT00021282001 [Paramecium tetraurelia]CAK87650.1 unnamed protein product [Paramecium tetraurelia]|eukprot:XP_001455047.1 hypothetical protein (macronuclear) [Paramecium tetraurelia strain d4-2]
MNQLSQELQSLRLAMNQKSRSNIEEEVQDEQDQGTIYCDRYGSGIYKSVSSYRAHIYQKNDGKTLRMNMQGIKDDNQDILNKLLTQDGQCIQILQWNFILINENTYKAIKIYPHFISLKEARNEQFSKALYYYNRQQSTHFGGMTVGFSKQFQSRRLQIYIFQTCSVILHMNGGLQLIEELLSDAYKFQTQINSIKQFSIIYEYKNTEIIMKNNGSIKGHQDKLSAETQTQTCQTDSQTSNQHCKSVYEILDIG